MLTTPVIRALQQQLNAKVHVLTKRSFAGVLSANPYVAKIWQIEKQVSEVLPALRQEGFDAIVDLHRNLRSRHVKLGLWGVPSYTFDKLNWKKWLLTRWQIDRMPDVHIVDRYLASVAPLGVKNDGEGLDHFLPEADRVAPTEHGLDQPFVALVIGAAHATKRLPNEKLRELCQHLSVPVALLGGPADEAAAVVTSTGLPHVHNFCGKLRLHQSADLLRQSSVVITHDTGLMHIAAALRKPIVSVWGNTVPEFGMYPYLPDSAPPHSIFQVKDLSCRPCSKIGYAECPKGHFRCMEEQDMVAIAQRAVTFFLL